ncbi:hypothetical protein HHX47_DHR5000694 [Lentinula edodes]|nr:hypothetical protein HHX47_DHR5000694 [Lentinula edodes]
MASFINVLSRLTPPPFAAPEEYDGLEYRWKLFVFRPAYFKNEVFLLGALLFYVAFFFVGQFVNAKKAEKCPINDLQLDFKLFSSALPHDFVWAVVAKDELKNIKDSRWDLVTDQPRERPSKLSKPEKHVILSLVCPPSSHVDDLNGLVSALFPFIDSLTKVSLRPETKTKLKKVRETFEKTLKVEAEQAKKEELEQAREDQKAARRKVEEERVSKLSAAEQQKILERERKRSIRKSQGKSVRKV